MSQDNHEFPTSALPVLPLRNGVLFPGTVITIPVGRPRSVALVTSLEEGAILGVTVQRDPKVNAPGLADLQPVGTYARVRKVTRAGERGYHILVEGLGRFDLRGLDTTGSFLRGEVTPRASRSDAPLEARALADALREESQRRLPAVAPEIQATLAQWDKLLGRAREPGLVADRLAGALNLDTEHEVEVLLADELSERLRRVGGLMEESLALAEVRRKIDAEVRRGFSEGQREAVLRLQLRAIKKELGEESQDGELDELRAQLDALPLGDEARRVVDRELARLAAMNPAQAEYNVIRTYLTTIAELPWDERVTAEIDIDAIAARLDADHDGLHEVKRRILEHMAVLKVAGRERATILCLAGPPGVGKTSLGQSIADATGRPFVRIALGGVRDEAEIRGHRRTYVGALPGRVIAALRRAGKRNPVILLDEIDKLSHGVMGSPEAALLEVLDPEQNRHFTDHYLELPFDLSEVIFLCTANNLSSLSPPLRDRLEVIEIAGYTAAEKAKIARNHLLPRALSDHALAEGTLTVSDAALEAVIRDYTREAGVRQLGRELTKLCRAVTLELARGSDEKGRRYAIDTAELAAYLGKVRYFSEVAERTAVAGVATGLAWTPSGGDILFIETSRMPGKGRLEITGQLGDVMKESARAALTFVRSRADELGVDPEFLEASDLHIHVPAGAVPKDGPSAGVTIFTALASLLSGRRVRPDTAMTGECTLRGRVLPVGGIKAKVLAAHRAGIRRVILPQRNARDLVEVPEDVREALEIVFAEDMSQVLAAALEEVGESALVGSSEPSLGLPGVARDPAVTTLA